jgi:integrase
VETLRAAWKWADREELLPDGLQDPTKKYSERLGFKYKERSRDRWLRLEETERLMLAVQAEDDPYVRAAIALFLLTGLRKRELLSARWSDVDLERGEIRLPDTKSGEPQTRTLTSDAVTILEGMPRMAESPFLFPSPKDPTRPRGDIKKPWERIRQAANLKDITLHDLRRTCGSYLAQAGVPLHTIGAILGHKDQVVTKLYARLARDDERQALEALARKLRGVLGLSQVEEKPDALPDRIRALLETEGNDPDALAAGLRRLVDWDGAVEA